MRKLLYLIVLIGLLPLEVNSLYAQNTAERPAVIRIDDPAKAEEPVTPVIVADGFSYYTTQNGIYLIFPKTNNNVKLFALTGQLIWSGELVSGRFYIPTGRGIYFLRVNNKSYKVSCK
jgi:hypothetical protein